jgi:heat shock protein HtpX
MFTRYPKGLASALEKLGGSRLPQADRSSVTRPMYIVRPHAAGAAGSLLSTHPPLAERIEVLRSMGGGAGLRAYADAFRRVAGRSIVGARSLGAAQDVPAREPGPAGEATALERARMASDAFLGASGYERVECQTCGAVLKIPPSLGSSLARCPRCRTALHP